MLNVRKIISVFVSIAITFSLVTVPASAAIDLFKPFTKVLVVPFSDFVVDILHAGDKIYDSLTGIQRENFKETVDFWSSLFGDDSTQSYDDYIATLDSPIVTFSDTAFCPPLFLDDAALEKLDEACEARSVYGYAYSDGHFEVTLGNSTYSNRSYYWFNGSLPLVSAPFTVSSTGTYAFHCGTRSWSSLYPSPNYFYIQVNTENGWANAHSINPPGSSDSSADCRLQAGLTYRFYIPLTLQSFSSILSGSYTGQICYFNWSGIGIEKKGQTVVPASTRISSFTQAINNYNTTNNTTNYYIGTTDANGSVNQVYDPDIFNEQTMIFKEPVTGEQYLCTGWKYSYSTGNRGYWLSLPENSYLYNGQSIRTVVLAYLDDALYIMGFRQELDVYDSIDDMSSDAVFLDKYDYVIATAANTTPEACQHVYTSETITAPTCTEQGVRRYTCELCGSTRDEQIPATGHAWEATETVETELNENGDVTKLGYTVYTCSVCGETYKQYDGTGQPGPPGASDTTSDSTFSWLASLFKKLISALVNGLASGLEYLVENVIVTVTDLFIQFTRWFFDLLDVDSLAEWFSWFSDDNKYFTNDFGGSEVDVWAYS